MSEHNGNNNGHKHRADKRELFKVEFLKDRNATQAAIRSGYSERTAYSQGQRLLKNVEVQQFIDKATEKAAIKAGITQDWVLNGIKEATERCMQAYPVLDKKGKQVLIEGADGNLVPAYTFQAFGALKGYELGGKHLKMFTDKTELSGPNGGPIELSGVSDDELANRASHLTQLVSRAKSA